MWLWIITAGFPPRGWNEWRFRAGVKKSVGLGAAIVRGGGRWVSRLHIGETDEGWSAVGVWNGGWKVDTQGTGGGGWRAFTWAWRSHAADLASSLPADSDPEGYQRGHAGEERSELMVCYFAPDGRQVNVTVAQITREHHGGRRWANPQADTDSCIVGVQWCNSVLTCSVYSWANCNIQRTMAAIAGFYDGRDGWEHVNVFFRTYTNYRYLPSSSSLHFKLRFITLCLLSIEAQKE